MATFRGTLQGERGEASRLAHRRLRVNANGWQGGVAVDLYKDADGRDCADIVLNDGSGHDGTRVSLWSGPIDENARAVLASGKWCGTDVMVKRHIPS